MKVWGQLERAQVEILASDPSTTALVGRIWYNSATNLFKVVDNAATVRAVILSGLAQIVNADVNASAAIAGTKISPNFGAQAVSTTGSGTFNSVVVGSAANTISALSTIVNTGTLTLPTSTDTLVGRATTDTLSNKSISGSSNTLSNIADGSLTTPYIKADGTRALTGSWAAGSFSGTFNGVAVGSSANSVTGLNTISSASATGLTFQTNAGTTQGSIASAGAWSIGAATFAGTHTIVGGFIQINAPSGTAIDVYLAPVGNGDAATWEIQAPATATSGTEYKNYYRVLTVSNAQWAVGMVYNTTTNPYQISQGSGLTTSTMFSITNAGLVTIGASAGTQTHKVNGKLLVRQDSTSTSFVGTPINHILIDNEDTTANNFAGIYASDNGGTNYSAALRFQTIDHTSKAGGFAIYVNSGSGLTNIFSIVGSTAIITVAGSFSFTNATSGYTAASLNYYEEGTFSANFNLGAGVSGSGTTFTVTFRRIGKKVTLEFPNCTTMTAGATNTTFVTATATVPTRLAPVNDLNFPCVAKVNNAFQQPVGQLIIGSDGHITLFREITGVATFTSATANNGFSAIAVSYTVA